MPRCAKCGLENMKGSKRCAQCNSKFFFGMTFVKSYKYTTSQKILIYIIKYALIAFLCFRAYEVITSFIGMEGDVVSILFGVIIVLISELPIFIIIYFIIRLLTISLEGSDDPNSIDPNQE